MICLCCKNNIICNIPALIVPADGIGWFINGINEWGGVCWYCFGLFKGGSVGPYAEAIRLQLFDDDDEWRPEPTFDSDLDHENGGNYCPWYVQRYACAGNGLRCISVIVFDW